MPSLISEKRLAFANYIKTEFDLLPEDFKSDDENKDIGRILMYEHERTRIRFRKSLLPKYRDSSKYMIEYTVHLNVLNTNNKWQREFMAWIYFKPYCGDKTELKTNRTVVFDNIVIQGINKGLCLMFPFHKNQPSCQESPLQVVAEYNISC
jgi:hypothetical protein